MALVEERVIIDRPRGEVWDVVSDLTSMAHYMPGVLRVHHVDGPTRGVGAGRHCTFHDGVELVEMVTNWREGEGYTLQTARFVKVPMRSNTIVFALLADGQRTEVVQSMRYSMKGGPVAPLLNWFARGMMIRALRGSLSGLKTYVESRG